MKTLAIALSVLVLVVFVQDVHCRPRRLPQGFRQRVRDQIGERAMRPVACRVRNTTADSLLCTETCPESLDCVAYPSPIRDGIDIEVHICLPMIPCEVEEDCPENGVCSSGRCFPLPPRVRCESAESAESSESASSSEFSSEEDSQTCRDVLEDILEVPCVDNAGEGQMGERVSGDEPRENGEGRQRGGNRPNNAPSRRRQRPSRGQ